MTVIEPSWNRPSRRDLGPSPAVEKPYGPTSLVTATAPDQPIAPLASLPRLGPARRRWSRWLSQAVSLALLLAVHMQWRQVAPSLWREALPDTPLFWLALVALYLVQPAADWVVFRRLWRLPPGGLPILLGKRIANELLMYSGEAYFYLWARRRAGLTTAPFGAIKDVNILSAMVGNLAALLLLLAVWPFLSGPLGAYAGPAVGSAVAMLAVSGAILLASRRLFTLSRPQRVEVSLVHLARLTAEVVLWAELGLLALPETPASLWLALSAFRLLVARLPFVPHKDLLFASLAALLLGTRQDVVAFVAMSSVAMLGLHLVFGLALAVWTFVLDAKPDAAAPAEA
jgi:hypothetical protein